MWLEVFPSEKLIWRGVAPKTAPDLTEHRMVCIGRHLKDHLVPTSLSWAGIPCTRPGCSKLQSTCLEHSWQHSQGNLCQHLTITINKSFLIYNLNQFCVNVKPLLLLLSLHALVKSLNRIKPSASTQLRNAAECSTGTATALSLIVLPFSHSQPTWGCTAGVRKRSWLRPEHEPAPRIEECTCTHCCNCDS